MKTISEHPRTNHFADLMIKYFMNAAVKRANDYLSAASKAFSLLRDYEVQGYIAALPDFTDSNSLPIGTTTVISPEKPVNPALIGMDIGCGYSFFSVETNPRRFYKKGKLRQVSVETVVSEIDHAIKTADRGDDKEFGTLGKGNHFIDMFVLEKAYDKSCQEHGIDNQHVYFMVHTGSRSKGFDTNAHFSKRFKRTPKEQSQSFNLDYLTAFETAKEYARKNREFLRKIIEQIMGKSTILYDKSHNDIEVQSNGNLKLKKGTSSLQEEEMFVIPGTCTDLAYAVIGQEGLSNTYNTINHGAGRKYTRHQAFERYRKGNLNKLFDSIVLNVDPRQMVEEVPIAYKKIGDVIDSVEEFNLARKIASLRPVAVIVDRGEDHGRK